MNIKTLGKRLISYLLIITMLATGAISLLPFGAFAEGDSTYTPMVLTEADTGLKSVQNGGTAVYDINDLIAIPYISEEPAEIKTYYLQNDLELTAANWTASGYKYINYYNFDGKNAEGRICEIKFNGAQYLFWYGTKASIRNLKLSGNITYAEGHNTHVAPLVVHGIDEDSTIENIECSVNIDFNGFVESGTDKSGVDISQGDNLKIGGLISKFENGTVLVKNVVFNGSMVINDNGTAMRNDGIGGIVGVSLGSATSLTMENCRNEGNITINGSFDSSNEIKAIGGLVASIAGKSATIKGCSNSGSITINGNLGGGGSGNNHAAVGGLVGEYYGFTGGTPTLTIEDCVNTETGDIEFTENGNATWSCAGGILGSTRDIADKKTINITNCRNEGDILNNNSSVATDGTVRYLRFGGIVGGVIGLNNDTANDVGAPTVTLSHCSNTGKIENKNASSSCVGGVVGHAQSAVLTLEDCQNTGALLSGNAISSTNAGLGGIIGYISNAGSNSKNYQRAVKITRCFNGGTLTAGINSNSNFHSSSQTGIGGMVGIATNTANLTLTDCVNANSVKATENTDKTTTTHWVAAWGGTGGMIGIYGNIGSLWGMPTSATGLQLSFTRCLNYGAVDGVYAGGILGTAIQIWHNAMSVTFTDCGNYGEIKAGDSGGGIVGEFGRSDNSDHPKTGKLTIQGCLNNANVTCGNGWDNYGGNADDVVRVGGIIGLTWGDSYSGNYNQGSINEEEKTVINGCANFGTISVANADGSPKGAVNGANGTGVSLASQIAGLIANKYEVTNNIAVGHVYNGTGSNKTELTDNNAKYHGFAYDSNKLSGSGNNDTNGQAQANAIKAAIDAFDNRVYEEADLKTILARKTSTSDSDGSIYLMNDITVSGALSTNGAEDYKTKLIDGNFYGNGYTITLGDVGTSTGGREALFTLIEDSNVYDLKLAGNITRSDRTTNELLEYASSLTCHGVEGECRFENISSTVNITASNTTYLRAVGGLVSKVPHNAKVVFKNCSYDGNITFDNCEFFGDDNVGVSNKFDSIGGIVGACENGSYTTPENSADFINCHSSGSISISKNGTISKLDVNKYVGLGGIIGLSNGTSTTLDNCSSSMTISDNNTEKIYYVGGIIGTLSKAATSKTSDLVLNNCTNTGTLSGLAAGGIIGGGAHDISADDKDKNETHEPIQLNGCVNKGDVTGAEAAGGLVGTIRVLGVDLIISDKSINSGVVNVTAASSVEYGCGGLVGDADKLTITDAVNEGNVDGYNHVGGIVGIANDTAELTRVTNRGYVNAEDIAGGIAATVRGASSSFTQCANGGAVYIFGNNGYQENSFYYSAAGGIVGYTTQAVSIEKCVNGNKITMHEAVGGDNVDTSGVGGMLGFSTAGESTKSTVDNCVNLGNIATGDGFVSNYYQNAYPMANPKHANVGSAGQEGNSYLQGTVSTANEDNYSLSTKVGTGSAIATKVNELLVYAFDIDTMHDYVARVEAALEDGTSFTPDEKTEMEAVLEPVKSVIDSDWSTRENWFTQNSLNIANAKIQTAMPEELPESNASYLITIPEIINVDAYTAVSVEPINFNGFSNFNMSLQSDFTLQNTASAEDILEYQILIDGNTIQNGADLCKIQGMTSEIVEKSIYVELKDGESTRIAGTYTDRVSFVISYSESTGVVDISQN